MKPKKIMIKKGYELNFSLKMPPLFKLLIQLFVSLDREIISIKTNIAVARTPCFCAGQHSATDSRRKAQWPHQRPGQYRPDRAFALSAGLGRGSAFSCLLLITITPLFLNRFD